MSVALPLPTGWELHYDAERHRAYFFNTVSQQSQWEMPFYSAKEVPPTPVPQPSQEHPHLAPQLAPPVVAAVVSEPAPLPPGWHEYVDPEGKTYYCHRESRKTTWDRPTTGDAPGPAWLTKSSEPSWTAPAPGSEQGAPAPAPTPTRSASVPSSGRLLPKWPPSSSSSSSSSSSRGASHPQPVAVAQPAPVQPAAVQPHVAEAKPQKPSYAAKLGDIAAKTAAGGAGFGFGRVIGCDAGAKVSSAIGLR